MILLSQKYQASRVAALWEQRYGRFQPDEVVRCNGRPAGETYTMLAEMDGRGTPADYARVIGNPSWCCETECDECGVASWDVVQLGEEPDYESATARICLDCLRKAVALVTQGEVEHG